MTGNTTPELTSIQQTILHDISNVTFWYPELEPERAQNFQKDIFCSTHEFDPDFHKKLRKTSKKTNKTRICIKNTFLKKNFLQQRFRVFLKARG
jgi:hypothetical protein